MSGAVIVIRQKRIMKHLRDCGAVSPESAIEAQGIPYSDRWYFRRLLNRGEVKESRGMYYLDEVRAATFTVRLLVRAVVSLLVVTGLVLLVGLVLK